MFFPIGAAFGLIVLLIFNQLKQSISLLNFLKALFTLSIILLPFVYDKIRNYLSSKSWFPFFLSSRSGGTRMQAFVLYSFLVFSSILLLYQGTFYASQKQIDLSWDQFEAKCGEVATGETKILVGDGNFLNIQTECTELRRALVQWEGNVKNVKINTVENFFDTFFAYLPYGLAHRLRCFYGDEVIVGRVDSKVQKRCSLSANNVYTFRIDVEPVPMGNASDHVLFIRLMASNGFKEIVQNLVRGDLVRFRATFDEELTLKYPTKMNLRKLECLKCKKGRPSKDDGVTVEENGFGQEIYRAFGSVFNFMFGPLIKIK